MLFSDVSHVPYLQAYMQLYMPIYAVYIQHGLQYRNEKCKMKEINQFSLDWQSFNMNMLGLI